MDNIIVAIDFSPNSIDALEYAKLFALHYNVKKIFLFHSLKDQDASNTVQYDLEQLAIPIDNHIQTECFVEEDDLDTGIIKKADEVNAKIIFMGITGKNKVGQKLVGSQVFKVVNNSHIPILMVPESVLFKKFEHITLALPFIENMVQKIPYQNINSIIKATNAALSIVNVTHKKEERNFVFKALTETFEMFDEMLPNYHFPSGSDISKIIIDYAEKNDAQLIISVAGSFDFFNRIFSPSITKKMAYNSNIPILIFKQA
ncbi:MAG TPA: universal stress protein [Edaphocola sp.]|nr:universal stress protein [Edaphocola sp.]